MKTRPLEVERLNDLNGSGRALKAAPGIHHLLVGNANVFISSALAASADSVVQMNDCVNDRPALSRKTTAVFMVNSGKHHARMAQLARSFAASGRFPQARLILSRSSDFYEEKRRALEAAGHPESDAFRVTLDPSRLPESLRPAEISYAAHAALGARLTALGMRPDQDASTGLVAYDWIRRRMRPGDRLSVVGFTHQGWRGHPWEIEKRLMEADLVETSPLLNKILPRGIWRRGLKLYSGAQRLLGV